MDYIAQLNGFWQWRRDNTLSNTALAMYMALLQLAEQSHTYEVVVQSSEIQSLLGLGKTAMYGCRKELEEAGLITFVKGNGGKTPVYCITKFDGPSLISEPRSTEPSLISGTRSEAPSLISDTRSEVPSLISGTRSGENGVPSLISEPRSQLPSNMYINNNNNIYINNTNTNNTKLLQVYTKQTENEEQVNLKECLDFFESNIRPLGNGFEGENLITLISEFGAEAFKGAVLLAKQNSVNNGHTWKWMQTVLSNGDWKYGYGAKKKKKQKRLPELDVVGLLESG